MKIVEVQNLGENFFGHVTNPMVPWRSPPMGHCRPYFCFLKKSIFLVVRWVNKWAWPNNKQKNKNKNRARIQFSPRGLGPSPEIFRVDADHMAAHLTSKVVWGPNPTNGDIAPKRCQKCHAPDQVNDKMLLPHINERRQIERHSAGLVATCCFKIGCTPLYKNFHPNSHRCNRQAVNERKEVTLNDIKKARRLNSNRKGCWQLSL